MLKHESAQFICEAIAKRVRFNPAAAQARLADSQKVAELNSHWKNEVIAIYDEIRETPKRKRQRLLRDYQAVELDAIAHGLGATD